LPFTMAALRARTCEALPVSVSAAST
jgi:hypothetical protein